MGHDARLNPHSKETQVVLPPTVLDRLGRPLDIGDEVATALKTDNLIWQVLDMRPILDARLPANMVRVVLTAPFTLTVPANQLVSEIWRVRARVERDGPNQEEHAGNAQLRIVPKPEGWRQKVKDAANRFRAKAR